MGTKWLILVAWWLGIAAGAMEAPLVTVRAATAGPVRPGNAIDVAWTIAIAPGWHVYWENPGDSGLPPQVQWTLPAGWRAERLQFPVPQRHDEAGLVSFIYEHQVVLFSRLQIPADARPGRQTLAAKVTWLVCKESCLPGQAVVTVDVEVDPSAPDLQSDPWSAARTLLPRQPPSHLRITAELASGPGKRTRSISVQVTGERLAADSSFFPLAEGSFTLANLKPEADGFRLHPTGEIPDRLTGVLTGIPGVRGVLVDVPISTMATLASGSPVSISLAAAVVAGLLGGLILNLMPCVLPVLALKLLGFAGHGGERRKIMLAAGGYTAGVVATMVVLAAVVLALRAAGAGIGWGFQLQEPAVVLGLAILFIAIACNLAGMFEIGLAATRLDPRRGGSFANGVLTTLVATPCGAPFASTAFGYALVAPVTEALLVFIALGLGLAAPVLLVAAFPATARWIPKPGPWMAGFKQFLALPLVGAAGWMIWSFQAVAGAEAAFLVLVLLIPLLLWSAWAWGQWQMAGPGAGKRVALALVATAALCGWIVTQPRPDAAGSAQHAAWQAWTPQRQAALLADQTPLLIDATAAWCLTCQVNKRTSLHDAQVLGAARDRGIILLRADFTNRDADLAAELARHGRASVPTYILYDRHGKASVLPDVLTPGILTDAFQAITPGAAP
jgi:DsbC/DsbD-like thiol-disulfide interchange protein/cytochrome c biogenesis protein CcdA